MRATLATGYLSGADALFRHLRTLTIVEYDRYQRENDRPTVEYKKAEYRVVRSIGTAKAFINFESR